MIGILLLLVLGIFGAGALWRRRRRAQERKRLQLVLLQVRAWLNAGELTDPDVRRWLSGISAQDADAMTTRLRAYLASLNWRPNWLFTPELKKSPALQQAVNESATTYLRSMLASQQLAHDARAYEIYLDMLQNRHKGRHSALIRGLYEALVAQQIIDPKTVRRRPFSRKVSRKNQLMAVLSAFERQPEAAMQVLKTLLTDPALLNTVV